MININRNAATMYSMCSKLTSDNKLIMKVLGCTWNEEEWLHLHLGEHPKILFITF